MNRPERPADPDTPPGSGEESTLAGNSPSLLPLDRAWLGFVLCGLWILIRHDQRPHVGWGDRFFVFPVIQVHLSIALLFLLFPIAIPRFAPRFRNVLCIALLASWIPIAMVLIAHAKPSVVGLLHMMMNPSPYLKLSAYSHFSLPLMVSIPLQSIVPFGCVLISLWHLWQALKKKHFSAWAASLLRLVGVSAPALMISGHINLVL